MTTSNKNIEKVLDNAFKIVRKGTKHRNDFVINQFERPITHLDFFQFLNNSNINLNSFEATKYMCHIKATDYVANWKSDVKLVVRKGMASIEIQHAEHLNISLNFEKFSNMLTWFKDDSLFTTDFGTTYESEQYYK